MLRDQSLGGAMRRSLFALLASIVALTACASGGTRHPAYDAGVSRDWGTRDTGTPLDLGGRDFGSPDFGSPDLGSDLDLGPASPDLGALDLGSADLGSADLGSADLGRADLGTPDLGAPDLGPPTGCTSAATCQDGLACNGVEGCIAGTCRPGTAIACDDGIACTTNSCTEPGGACAFARNDSACPAGSTCTAPTASGCTSTSTCTESPCRLVSPQCGCTGTQACVVSAGARLCAAAGTGATGTACGTGTSGCAAGNLCVGVTATGTGSACEHFCTTDADCTGAGALCILTLNDGAGGTVPGATLCSLSCNPLNGSGCPTGSTCRVFVESAGSARYLTHCEGPVGGGTDFTPCTTDSECAAGYACIDLGFGTECAHWCNATTGTGCTLGLTCSTFTTPVLIGTREYGICN